MHIFPASPQRSRLLRRLLQAIGAAALLTFAVAALLLVQSERRLQRDYGLRLTLPNPDPKLREEGGRLAVSRGCADCHGSDFAGRVIADDMPFGRLVGDNLTRMPPDSKRRSVHERMYLALHHGLNLDARPLLMMPSKEFTSLSAREIEALSAYFASLAPVERELPDSTLGPLGRALLAAGQLDGFLSAEVIDHVTPAVAEAPPRGTVAYGQHAARLCTGCHRADFGGGRMSHGGPAAPPAANLTRATTGLGGWTEEDFVIALRQGRRPDGNMIDSKYMPWKAFGRADEDELRAVWRYLRSLPPVERDVHTSAP